MVSSEKGLLTVSSKIAIGCNVLISYEYVENSPKYTQLKLPSPKHMKKDEKL